MRSEVLLIITLYFKQKDTIFFNPSKRMYIYLYIYRERDTRYIAYE